MNDLELFIMQYLDGTLPAKERAALERRLTENMEARRLFEQHQALAGALKQRALPAVQWEQLTSCISSAVDAQAAAEQVDDQLELAITQYLDGDLSPAERIALERRVETDVAAAKALAEHRSLDVVLKRAWPVPQVKWEALTEFLSEGVSEAAQRARYSIAWVRRAVPLAAAACILIAIGLGIHLYSTPLPSSAVVQGPTPEPAAGQPIVQITIGVSDAAAHNSIDPYSSGIVSLPSRVQLASSSRVPVEAGPFQY